MPMPAPGSVPLASMPRFSNPLSSASRASAFPSLPLPPQPAIAVLFVQDGQYHHASLDDAVVGAIVSDAQPVKRRDESGHAFDPGFDLLKWRGGETFLDFLKNDVGNSRGKTLDLSLGVTVELDREPAWRVVQSLSPFSTCSSETPPFSR